MLENVWDVKNAFVTSFAKLNLVFVAPGVIIMGKYSDGAISELYSFFVDL